jgi:phosphatidylglycerol:prolipoprotein diacylglycerol transferase
VFPEIFRIPFTQLTIKSYGLMLVIGFLAAVALAKRISRNITSNPQIISDIALYGLIAGVIGARLFYVVHYFREKFQGHLLSVFAIWQGGLEFLGGIILAVAVVIFYLWRRKLPIRRCLDILAISLMLAVVFGRIGCLLNGCCFGKPTNLPWAVRFPYGSFAYRSQVYPNLERGRSQPQLILPSEFFGYYDDNGVWVQDLKPEKNLDWQQREMVEKGPYRCLPVHPTQLYLSAVAAVMCAALYFFWRSYQNPDPQNRKLMFQKPGCTFGLAFVLYGITRFFMEFLRDDNPFEFDGLTVSQIMSIAMVALGIALILIFEKMGRDKPEPAK